MWHTWTLDPLATGWMLVAVWNYTKLIPYLEKESKTYEFTVMLNGTTSSLDLAEEIEYISKESQKIAKKDITIEKIQEIINNKFIWEITQIPPKYSAIKNRLKKSIWPCKSRTGCENEREKNHNSWTWNHFI